MIMMQPILKYIHKYLLEKRLRVAVAESCSGGLLSKMLSDTPGSSAYFMLGIVAYSNRAKESILKVPAKVISARGAISAEVCRRMAQGVRKLAAADIGVGITGIAGPSGGTAKKPLGTVFIAIAGQKKTISRKFRLRGSRAAIRRKAALQALELLKATLTNKRSIQKIKSPSL